MFPCEIGSDNVLTLPSLSAVGSQQKMAKTEKSRNISMNILSRNLKANTKRNC